MRLRRGGLARDDAAPDGHAAVDHDGGARHEACLVGREEDDDFRYLLRPCDPAYRTVVVLAESVRDRAMNALFRQLCR